MNKSNRRTPKETRGAILGTLLGDSWITGLNHFGCEQVSKPLIELKAEILSHYLDDSKIAISERQRKDIDIEGRRVQGRTTYTIRARHPRFRILKKLFYRTGSKQVTYNILKFVSAEGLALWVMDDGYMDYKRGSSTRNLRICTDSYDEISHKEMIRYFKESWDIDAKIYWHKRHKDASPKPRISFNATNSQKLISIIYPWILDQFLYKIDMQYKEETLDSKRCSKEYLEAAKYISQRRAILKD